MKKCCGFLVNNMALFVLLIGVVGAVRPQTLTWVGPYVGWLLGVVMFGMGMTLTFQDFKRVLQRPWEVLLGVVAQFLIMPLAAWFLVWLFALPPELAIGVVLVGTCPGGTASNVISYLAKGDVALSVSMTMATTLLAPVVTPTLTWLLAGSWIEVSFTAMMISIAQMVLLPLLLGLTAHHFFERTVEKILPVMPVVSVVTIVLLVGGVVALGAESLLDVGLLMAAIVVLHNAFGLVLGYGMARLFRLDSKKARTVSIEVGMQNSGMAASLAVLYFSPAAAIPGAIFSVWHNISGSIVANYFARRDERKNVDVKNVESIHLA
ncbi:bile acid:sodium symporter family protein [Megasphaera butyrica]|uniref:bile acid:sodium symporter family protein n=1 Tax=Megasphaera butyrica TaxID=2981791 RepID=UPI0008203189|nr:bile acid:sodium symporter family protein [Megasphaera butyrica]MCU6714154.1 bile acid:sodium symporter family protein [Megasphaera butyrica]SCH41262.1 bile acid transporter [uncultured Megasphaera sp.]SCJ08735.1 bile acid transporter [uncultured Ruminococcus sp.]